MAVSGLIRYLAGSLNISARDMLARARIRSPFRTLALRALELDAEAHGQSLEYTSGTVGSASLDDVDVLLPEGLGDLTGRLGVELWFPAANASTAESLFERLERSSVRMRTAYEGRSRWRGMSRHFFGSLSKKGIRGRQHRRSARFPAGSSRRSLRARQ